MELALRAKAQVSQPLVSESKNAGLALTGYSTWESETSTLAREHKKVWANVSQPKSLRVYPAS